MSSRSNSEFGSLGDRTRKSIDPASRHILVRRNGVWMPGLLLEWRHTEAGWTGRVAWITDGQGTLCIGVVAAADLKPATS